MDSSASTSAHDAHRAEAPPAAVGSGGGGARNNVVVKVGMVGDAQVGKTSLMVKYVEGKFDEDYIHTLGARLLLLRLLRFVWRAAYLKLTLSVSIARPLAARR